MPGCSAVGRSYRANCQVFVEHSANHRVSSLGGISIRGHHDEVLSGPSTQTLAPDVPSTSPPDGGENRNPLGGDASADPSRLESAAPRMCG